MRKPSEFQKIVLLLIAVTVVGVSWLLVVLRYYP